MKIYFDKNIKWLRKSRRMTQIEVAKEMDVKPTTVVHWEGGRSTPQFAILVKLRQFFGVNLEALVFHDLTKGHPPDLPPDTEMNSEDVKRIEQALEALNQKVDRVAEIEEEIKQLRQQVESMQDRRHRRGNTLDDKIDDAIEGHIG